MQYCVVWTPSRKICCCKKPQIHNWIWRESTPFSENLGLSKSSLITSVLVPFYVTSKLKNCPTTQTTICTTIWKIHRKQIRIHQDPNYAFGNQPSYPQDPTITWKWYDLETNGITNKETRLGIEARKITSSDNPSVMISLVLSIFTTPKPNVIPFPLEVSILNTSSVTSSYTFSIPLENISYVT